jgi:hypothetical protein
MHHLHRPPELRTVQACQQRLGDLDRCHARQARQLHADGRGIVTHLALFGAFYGDFLGQSERREFATALRVL